MYVKWSRSGEALFRPSQGVWNRKGKDALSNTERSVQNELARHGLQTIIGQATLYGLKRFVRDRSR